MSDQDLINFASEIIAHRGDPMDETRSQYARTECLAIYKEVLEVGEDGPFLDEARRVVGRWVV